MAILHRHQLAQLSDAGWAGVLARPWDRIAHACLTHWATQRLPLVVTRQPADIVAGAALALGLPAPARWDRRRLALQVPRAALLGLGEFPLLADMQTLLAPPTHGAVRDLLGALDACAASARVFGSYGWQAISGLDHVRPTSDLDLCVAVDGVAHADAVAHALQSFGSARLRLDGELLFDDGAAVAWREWAAWRAGHARTVLVKGLYGVALQRDTAWCQGSALTALVE